MPAFLLPLLIFFSCIAHADQVSRDDVREHDFSYVNRLKWSIVETRDHDPKRFTQGLAIHDRSLYESSGLYGRSALFVTDLRSGAERRIAQLLPTFFGEGLTVWRDQLVMLTWREGAALFFDLRGKPTMQRRFDGEGWGIASDGARLIMSDGSADLVTRDAETFAEISRITVRAGSTPVTRLNELEYARGSVFANIWQTDDIVQIDPRSGEVIARLDLAELRQRFEKPAGWNPADHVLNGIAHDPATDRFYVTGKCWPKMFVLKVETAAPRQQPAAAHTDPVR